MLLGDWEAKVVYEPGRSTNAIYLTRHTASGREYMLAEDTIRTLRQGETTDQDLTFARLDDEQMRALLVAFDSHGVKRPEASYTQGKLEATEGHLEDMRLIALSKYYKEEK